MRELGPDAAAYHREIGEHARAAGVELLIGVGELGREYAPDERGRRRRGGGRRARRALGEGDAVLVKGSRAVGLEPVAERLGDG